MRSCHHESCNFLNESNTSENSHNYAKYLHVLSERGIYSKWFWSWSTPSVWLPSPCESTLNSAVVQQMHLNIQCSRSHSSEWVLENNQPPWKLRLFLTFFQTPSVAVLHVVSGRYYYHNRFADRRAGQPDPRYQQLPSQSLGSQSIWEGKADHSIVSFKWRSVESEEKNKKPAGVKGWISQRRE